MIKTMDDLRAAKLAAKTLYEKTPGILGFGIGEDTIHIYCENKAVSEQLQEEIDGVKITPIITGKIVAY